MKYVSCADLLSRLDNEVGKHVAVHGEIVISKETFIATDYDGYRRGERILIHDGGLVEQVLLDKLPPYGGGLCCYIEEAWVIGHLTRMATGMALSLEFCKVRRGDVEVVI